MKNKFFKLSEKCASLISNLACYNGVLPQGSPLSPVLTNIIFQPCDIQLLNYSKKHKLTYSRYADDLTFSTNKNIDKDKVINDIYQILKRCGFEANVAKTRVRSKYTHQEVTGLVVNQRLNTSKSYFQKARAMTHNLILNGAIAYIAAISDTLLPNNTSIGLR